MLLRSQEKPYNRHEPWAYLPEAESSDEEVLDPYCPPVTPPSGSTRTIPRPGDASVIRCPFKKNSARR